MSAPIRERNQEATLWVGNLAEGVDEELLWELFLQAGPLTDVSMPRDKVNGRAQGFAFVEFSREEDAAYAVAVLNITLLCGNPIRVRKSAGLGGGGVDGRKVGDIGANLFVGNLGPEATERTLYDTFGAFGVIVDAHVQREAVSGTPRGFGFVNFDTFEGADAAIEALSGQFLAGRQAVVQFAFRKDAPTERHGSSAERTLAAAARGGRGCGGIGTSGTGGVFPSAPHVFFASAHGVLDATPFGGSVMPRAVVGGADAPARADPALTLMQGQGQGLGLGYWVSGAPLPPGLMPPQLPTFAFPPPAAGSAAAAAWVLPPLPAPPGSQMPPPLPGLPAPPAAVGMETVLAGGRRDIRPAWMKT